MKKQNRTKTAPKIGAKSNRTKIKKYSRLQVATPSVTKELQRIAAATPSVTPSLSRLQSLLKQLKANGPYAGLMVIDVSPPPRRDEVQPFTENFLKGLGFATQAWSVSKTPIGFTGSSVWQQAVRINPSDQSKKHVLRCSLFFHPSKNDRHVGEQFHSLVVPPMTIDADGDYLFSVSTLTILERAVDPIEIGKRIGEIESSRNTIFSVGTFNQRGNVPSWVKP